MYCLTADKGEVVWQHLVRAPIWGTSPVVDGRLVFGDKAGWIYMLSVEDGKRLGELKIGDNLNSTPAVLGRSHLYWRFQWKPLLPGHESSQLAGDRGHC